MSEQASGVAVARADEIPPGHGMGAEVKGLEIAVFNVDGEFYAVSNRCPHKGASLCEAGGDKLNADKCVSKTRGRVDGGENPSIRCPWHWWSWDLKTGENPFVDMRVRTFDVVVEDDEVLVSV